METAIPGSRLQSGDTRVLWRWAGAIVLWGATVLALSLTGALGGVPVLALPVLIVAGMAVPLWLVSRSPVMRRIVRDVDLAYLTWFNTTRVPAALGFIAAGAHGLLPGQFVTNAAWGDLAAGLLAPVVIVLAARLTARSRYRVYLAYHMFGLGDLLVAVATGLTFILLGEPLMRTLLDTPVAFIALWGVPLNGTFSLLALHRLVARRG